MTPARRWLVVVVVALAVLTPAVLPRVWPAQASDRPLLALANQARNSVDRAWSGQVATTGGLPVPKVEDFAGVASLFGRAQDLRVWWRDQEHWRVDRVRDSGEADLVRDENSVVRWTYESRRATITRYSDVRLPFEADVLPTTLAARLLAGADQADLSRLPSRRVDGRSAAGFRYVPADRRSTIGRVEVWNDAASGIPVRVDVYGLKGTVPVISTQTSHLEVGTPAEDDTEFAFPPGVRVRTSYALDAAAGANAFAPFHPPDQIADLRRRTTLGEGVGVYGKGALAMVLIPLRRPVGREVYNQLDKSPAAIHYEDGSIGLLVGPLSILLKAQGRDTFLVAGTISSQLLGSVRAALANVHVGDDQRQRPRGEKGRGGPS